MKLHFKIAILIAVIALIMGVFNVYWSGVNIKEVLQDEMALRGTVIAQKTVYFNTQLLLENNVPALTHQLQQVRRSEPSVEYLYITDPAGNVLAHTFADGLPPYLKTLPRSSGLDTTVQKIAGSPKAHFQISYPINLVSGGVLHIGMNNDVLDHQMAVIETQEIVFLIILAVIAVIIGVVMVRRVTLPVVTLAEQIRQYGRSGEVPAQMLSAKNAGYEAQLLTTAFKDMLNTRLEIEQRLSQREAEFAAMFNSMVDAVLFADPDRIVRLCNPAAEKLFGYSREELIGQRTQMMYVDPGDFDKQGQLRYRQGDGTDIKPYEVRYKRKDGSVFYGETRGTQVKDAHGNFIGFIAIFRDISEEKRRREELNQFKSTLDDTLDCVFMFRPDTLNFFYVNKGAIEQVGYRREELLNMTPVEIKPEYDEPRFRSLLQPLLDGSRHSITFETVHQHKDGRHVPVEIFLQYLAPADETPRFVAIVRDLTERKRAEKVLYERHQLLMLIINNAPLVLFVIDPNGIFKLSLGKGLENLGLEPGQMIGQSAFEVYAENQQILKDIKSSLAGEHVVSYTVVAGRNFETFYSPFYNSDGSFAGTVGVALDITERRQAELELRKHRDLLEELVAQRTHELAAANKELEAFSYSVSHDLRAPLRSIDGFSHILLDDYGTQLDPTATGYLHRIRTAAQRMAQLIDDLLELSRVTRNELFIEPVNITALAETIVGDLKAANPERQAKISIEPKLRVQGDVNLLHIMLQNLIANAWKYTGKKAVAEITLGKLDAEQNNIFYIRDNGAGFDMRYANKLFGAFQRLHGSDEFEGTGIGLATVQRIIERHGGKVWGESEIGKGATFYFQLPAAVASATKH
ncbi:MAG: PAS domain S-box protein [Gammaproteobacteria bacterium]